MKIRLGYVAMTLNLEDCSPSKTVTVKALTSLPDDKTRINKLRRITKANLTNTLRILRYNKAYNISVYRFTSKLVPLATHPIVSNWDYIGDFADDFKQIGDYVKENQFRVSAHPDHFTLINSPSKEVMENSIKDLDYHVKVFEAMGLEDYRYKHVLHTGGVYGDKSSSIKRFKENFIKLPDRIRNRIILENDDKVYTAKDVLEICVDVGLPMVLDVHHHNCVNNGESLEDILYEIFDTWKDEYFKPKVHFSTPKNTRQFRSHADDIDINDFYQFLKISKKTEIDFDIMLEAKNKDQALLNLSNELKQFSDIKWIDEGHFEM
ncbi:UNVERIFIED_CONTAM: UV-damage endonuclease [Acetivibrio alkalicellulosi]